MKKLLFGLLVSMTMISCGVNSSEVNGNDFKNELSYFQCKKTGEVFSVVGIRQDFKVVQSGIGLAHIDRDDVTEVIKRQIKGFKDFSEFK